MQSESITCSITGTGLEMFSACVYASETITISIHTYTLDRFVFISSFITIFFFSMAMKKKVKRIFRKRATDEECNYGVFMVPCSTNDQN